MINNIDKLPDEILLIIFNYINLEKKIFLNKYYYNNYSHLIINLIPKHNYHSYLRSIIRNDSKFSFINILSLNFSFWINNITNYKYNNTYYENYLSFLIQLCKKYNSNKCLNLITDKLYKNGLNNYKFKTKNLNKNKWSF